MRQSKSSSLRGSVTQNNISVRVDDDRARLGIAGRLGLTIVALIVLMLGLGWLFHSTWPQRQYDKAVTAWLSLTQQVGFSINDITVQGRQHTGRDEVLGTLGVTRGAAIFAFDAQQAAEKLDKLPWVQSVVVERRLPDSINVVLNERVPMARWQFEERMHVIDAEGRTLPAAKADDFPNLPAVVGTGANDKAKDLLLTLREFPEIMKRLTSAVRVGERRWDIYLSPKILVRLPESGYDGALRRLSLMMTQDKILDRDIVAIDLRIPDRYTLEPASSAASPSSSSPSAGASRP